MWGATKELLQRVTVCVVSIHALRVGRDGFSGAGCSSLESFNPRAPCGARLFPCYCGAATNRFQSTRPVRGATATLSSSIASARVSIHAPRAGRDALRSPVYSGRSRFNPRAPCGARPRRHSMMLRPSCFNPRAPCGARLMTATKRRCRSSFNPRAPCGARHCVCTSSKPFWRFQSTRPVRGATGDYIITDTNFTFQSTRPVRGATRRQGREYYHAKFQSTRPVRGATSDRPHYDARS